MITVRDNDFWRGTEKIGYILDNDIYDHNGKKAGYFENTHIYDHEGRKIAYIQGNEVISITDDDRKFKLDENRRHVVGGVLSDAARAAVRLFLGD